jgi:GTP-binding nuclear protein Ran
MADPKPKPTPEKSENKSNNMSQSPAKEIALFNFEWKSEPQDKAKIVSPEKPFSFTLDPQLAASMATLSVSPTKSPSKPEDIKPADPPPPFDKPKEFKICLIGDEQVGKTCYIDRILGGQYKRDYEATKQLEVRDVNLETNRGPITFHVWDIAGKDDGLGDAYYIGCHGTIIMFDVTRKSTYTSVPEWYKDIQRVEIDRPVVLVGNKWDVLERQVAKKDVKFHQKKGLQYYEVSVKTGHYLKAPFLALARALVQDPHLTFTDEEDKLDTTKSPTKTVEESTTKKDEA